MAHINLDVSKYFSISNNDFVANDISIQFNIDDPNIKNNVVDLTISVQNSKFNCDYFFNIYDNCKISNFSDKFEIVSNTFISKGCVIKSLFTDPQRGILILNILSDDTIIKPISERRDEIIDKLITKNL